MRAFDVLTLLIAILMPLATFQLGRMVKARDRNRRTIEWLIDDVRDIGDDLREGFRQLSGAMPTFNYHPRSRPRPRDGEGRP